MTLSNRKKKNNLNCKQKPTPKGRFYYYFVGANIVRPFYVRA